MKTILFFLSLIFVSHTLRLRQENIENNDKIYILSKVDNFCVGTRYVESGDAFQGNCDNSEFRFEWKLRYNPEDGTYFILKYNLLSFYVYKIQYAMHFQTDFHNSIMTLRREFSDKIENMRFYIEATPDKRYYKIRHMKTNFCLQVGKPGEISNIYIRSECNEEKNLFYFQSPLGKEYIPEGVKNLPVPINDPVPAPINDPVPVPINDPVPALINDPVPVPINDPVPVPINDPVPAPINDPVPAPINDPVPAPINDPVPAPINDPVPALDEVPSPIVTSPDPLQASKPKSCVRSYFSFLPRTQFETYQPNYFNGIWYVDGLFCDNQFVSTSVEIKNFTAITLEQNPCYSQGSILFTDKVSPTVIRSNHNIAVTYYLENNEKSRVWLSVTGKNTFVISKYYLTFYRKLD